MLTCHPQTIPPPVPREPYDQARARHSMVMGRLNVPLMKATNPDIICLDYVQPMSWNSWTRYIISLSGTDPATFGSAQPGNPDYRDAVSEGIVIHLNNIGADGIFIDTPLLTDDLAGAVLLNRQVTDTVSPKITSINFGSFDAFMGQSFPEYGELLEFCNWPLVEVWVNINKVTLTQITQRFAFAKSQVEDFGKSPILGIYDEGGVSRLKARQMMQTTVPFYWSHKISLDRWEFVA